MNVYTCLDCKKSSTDHTEFKMVGHKVLAFVVCNDCLAIPGRYNV